MSGPPVRELRLYDSKRFIACIYRRGDAPPAVETAIVDDESGDFVVVREDPELDVIGCFTTLEEACCIAERLDEASER